MHEPSSSHEPSSLRVMVVDDSAAVRRNLVALMSTLDGVQVVGEAESVTAAIKRVTALVPDVVVLDIQMGDGTGIEVLRYIKRTIPATQVIMLTNHSNDFYRDMCLREGAAHFLDKSTDFDKIREMLTQAAS